MSALDTALADYRSAHAALVAAAERLRAAAEIEGGLGVGHGPAELGTIMRTVAAHYGYSAAMLADRNKTAPVVRARQVAMWACRKYTAHSSMVIAGAFDRDHATVLWAVQSVEELLLTDKKFPATLHLVRSAVECALKK